MADYINICIETAHCRRPLRRTEGIDKLAINLFIDAPDQFGRAGRPSCIDSRERAKVEVLQILKAYNSLHKGRHCGKGRDLFTLNDFTDILCVCTIGKYILCTVEEGATHTVVYCLGMAHRGCSKHGIITCDLPCPCVVLNAGNVVIVCPGNCFGDTCCATCREDYRDLYGFRPSGSQSFEV